ncbi:MAG: hypothetical protein OXD49_02345 [Candidatus Poribacteria bacterium]|nr:hypothetical protein [Candidatus Poribacteria bacterium]
MITITVLDLSNPKNPLAIINDTGATGSEQSVPLLQLFAAMSDYRFAYIAPNAVIPEINQQQRYKNSDQDTGATVARKLEANDGTFSEYSE